MASAFHRQRPADVKARNLLASSSFTAAMAAPSSAQISAWQGTGGLYDALLADEPDNPDNQRNAALVDKYLGTQYQLRGDLTRALQHHQRALALDEKRLARAPSVRGTQLDVAILSATSQAFVGLKRVQRRFRCTNGVSPSARPWPTATHRMCLLDRDLPSPTSNWRGFCSSRASCLGHWSMPAAPSISMNLPRATG